MPSLKQMQAIAADLGLPAGELPPLGGAGGQWLMPIQRQVTSPGIAGPVKPGFVFRSRVQDLITGAGADPIGLPAVLNGPPNTGPTLMQEFLLSTLRLPIGVQVNAQAKPAVQIIFTFTVLLRIGGDLVWTQTVEVPTINDGFGAEEKQQKANFTVGQDFQNPIVLRYGKQLTLQCEGYFNVEVKLSSETAFGINTIFERFNAGLLEINNGSGTIAYSSRDLTGHREL